jgi:MFS family permease
MTADGRFGGPLLWHRDFRLLWGGETISVIGSQVSLLAIPLLAVRSLNATTFEVGVLTAASTAAFLLVGLPAGAWVDRLRRRPVMITADLGRMIALGSVPVASPSAC